MSAATPMAFGGLSNGFGRTPRHIPVHDEDVSEKHSDQLTGYMVDPRYLRHDETASVPSATMTGERVPPLTTLDSAERFAEQDIEETEHRIFWHDWRHIIFPVATILFIMALGLADVIFRVSSPPAPIETTQQKPQSNASDATTSSPSPSSAASGRGGSESQSPSASNSPQTTPNISPQPSGSSDSSGISQPAEGSSEIGGRGGGGDAGGILQPSSLTEPNAASIQGK